MTPVGFSLFDTEIGRCGVAWSQSGVVALQLPERSDSVTRARLQERARGAVEMPPPSDIRAVVVAVASQLRGEATDLSGVALDMDRVPLFHQRVYDVARNIPSGATLSYGDVAGRLGNSGAARAVGQALGRNPFPIIVPCHRVLAAGGRIGGFSANGGTSTKLRLLSIEGVFIGSERRLFP